MINVNDKSITEQLQEAAAEMCEHFCKYQSMIKDCKETQAVEMIEHTFCSICPMNKII